MSKKNISIEGSKILVMGLTFKENCPDIRNTRVVDLIKELEILKCFVDVYDPWVNKKDSFDEYGLNPIDRPDNGKYDAIILAVAHNEFKELSLKQIKSFARENNVIYDIKYLLKEGDSDGRL
jgi:UDP-N-acetyl-D-galactosamine dehydrogenase